MGVQKWGSRFCTDPPTEAVTQIVHDLISQDAFVHTPGREGYQSFPHFNSNLLEQLDYRDLGQIKKITWLASPPASRFLPPLDFIVNLFVLQFNLKLFYNLIFEFPKHSVVAAPVLATSTNRQDCYSLHREVEAKHELSMLMLTTLLRYFVTRRSSASNLKNILCLSAWTTNTPSKLVNLIVLLRQWSVASKFLLP